jgi:hypothetical protein
MRDLRTDLSKSKASRFVASGLAVAVLAALLTLSSAIPASAEEKVCGVPQGEPTYDLAGLQQMLKQGNQNVINDIRRAFNLGTEWCGPLEFATAVGARVVAGTVWKLVEIKVPLQYDVIIAVVEEAWERLHPSRLPDVGGSGSGVSAPVAWTGGLGVYLRPNPARTASIGSVPEGATVSIQCTARGETVSGPFGPTDLWDYVLYNGQAGYVSDGYVNTGTNDPVAPNC